MRSPWLPARMVEQPWDYHWSSCRHYALGEVDPLLAANPWYEGLSTGPERRQELWREFLLGDDAKEAVIRRSDWVVGGKDFRRRQQQPRGRAVPRHQGRPSKPGAATDGFL